MHWLHFLNNKAGVGVNFADVIEMEINLTQRHGYIQIFNSGFMPCG